jgi:F-type H+-transporting ATPase subunit b
MATDTNDALVEVGHHHLEPTLLGLDAEGWVYVGLTIFLLLAIFVAKAPKKVAAILDQRILDTRKSLDEAQALRAEAEALLADAKKQQAAAHKDAEGIIAHAKTEAAQMITQAKTDADTLIERRHKMAEDKIAAAERMAIADVRAKAATAAAAAAAALIAQRHDGRADKVLVDATIANLN